jgi:uncharacterized membrane protein YjdF
LVAHRTGLRPEHDRARDPDQKTCGGGARLADFIVCSIALAVSACYELVEWRVALASGTDAEAFLATHGDVWDTQWDMFMALCGAILAQLTLSRLHDRQLVGLGPAPSV